MVKKFVGAVLALGLALGGVVTAGAAAEAASAPSIPPGFVDCLTWGESPLMTVPCSKAQWDSYFDFTSARVRAGLPAVPLRSEYSSFSAYFASNPEFAIDPKYDVVKESAGWAEDVAKSSGKPVPKVTVKPFTPSTSKARAYMINTLGSVLKGATPDKWKREMLANQHQYNHSWDALNTEFGYSANSLDVNGQMRPIPKAGTGTYDDEVIREYEKKAKTGGKGGAPMQVAATKATPFKKAAGAVGEAAIALTMMPVGFMIGNVATSLFGFDPDSGVCWQYPGALRDVFANITGADCTAYDFPPEYTANMDGTVTAAGGVVCSSNGVCAQLLGGAQYQDRYNGCGGAGVNTCEFVVACWAHSTGSWAGAPGFGYGKVDAPGTVVTVGGAQFQQNAGGTVGGNACMAAYPSSAFGAWGAYLGGAADWAAPKVFTTHSQNLTLGVSTAYEDFASSVAVYGFYNSSGWFGETADATRTSSDPERSLTCSIEGDDGATYTAESAPFRESSGALAPAECPGLPEGVRPVNVKVTEDSPAGNVDVYDEDVTPEYAAWFDNYPECRTGACKLDLLIKPAGGAPAIASCFDAETECVDWFEQPNKGDLYQCRYGVHDVSIDECALYAGVFKPERLIVGAPYSDPETGEWSGGQSSPSAANDMMNSPVQNPDAARDCFTKGWAAFNPVEWVLTPIRCSLEWAFVPRQTVIMLKGASLASAWDGTAFGQVGAILAPFSAIPMSTGCTGWPVDLVNDWPQHWEWHLTLGAACDGPLSVLAGVIRTVSGGLLALGGMFAISSYLGVTLGFRGFGRGGSE